jgi:hypothetical protein
VIVGAVGAGFAAWGASGHTARSPVGYRQGSCVVVGAEELGGELHGKNVSCAVDPSFTVAKIADQSNNCGAENYTRIRPPFSDVATGRLCLVPNLVVGHCYRYGVPMGTWDLVGCANAGAAAIKVAKRIDTDDPHACPMQYEPPTPGIRTVSMPKALRYPSRVYCYDDPAD